MSYEWIIGEDFAKTEVRTSYLRYKRARKYSDPQWFEYWLDYLHNKNRYEIK